MPFLMTKVSCKMAGRGDGNFTFNPRMVERCWHVLLDKVPRDLLKQNVGSRGWEYPKASNGLLEGTRKAWAHRILLLQDKCSSSRLVHPSWTKWLTSSGFSRSKHSVPEM